MTWVVWIGLAGVAAQAPEEKLGPAGERPDLVMMYTGDVIGYLEDCGCKKNPAGGVARRAWVTKQIRNRYPGVPMLMLDSGNFSDNPTPRGDVKTRTLLQAMERLGYEVVNVGERDVRNGYDHFVERTDGFPFRFISANIVRKDNSEPIFEPYAVVELSEEGSERKIRVGVVGVARYNPVFLKQGPDGSNMVVTHHVEAVRTQVEILRRKEEVDLVVVLAALHLHDAKSIAEQVGGIDYILGAYGGMFHEENVGTTSILFCGNRGQRIVETRVQLYEFPLAESDTVRMHFMTRDYPESAPMRRWLDEESELALATASGGDAPAAGGAAEASRAGR
jgi:2',3'-cyclic-nucleotide 2'-phosphodiesterase (5'-nucleotidase family)